MFLIYNTYLCRREARKGAGQSSHGARSVVSLNRRKVPSWFPSSAPSQGVQQEFIVSAANTLQRNAQLHIAEQSPPKNCQRAADRLYIFHNLHIAGRTHFGLACLSLLSNMQITKNLFQQLTTTTTQSDKET